MQFGVVRQESHVDWRRVCSVIAVVLLLSLAATDALALTIHRARSGDLTECPDLACAAAGGPGVASFPIGGSDGDAIAADASQFYRARNGRLFIYTDPAGAANGTASGAGYVTDINWDGGNDDALATDGTLFYRVRNGRLFTYTDVAGAAIGTASGTGYVSDINWDGADDDALAADGTSVFRVRGGTLYEYALADLADAAVTGGTPLSTTSWSGSNGDGIAALVPEPGTAMLLGIALGAFGLRSRRSTAQS